MRHEQARLAMCMLLVLLGLAVLAGWLWRIEALKSLVPGLSTMKFNAAVGFVLVGGGLAAAGFPNRLITRLGSTAGALAIALGGLTLAQFIAQADLGIDQLVVADTGTLRGSGVPGRMSPLTATSIVVLGAAVMLLTLGRDRRSIIAAHMLAGCAGFIAFLAVAGYAFGAQAFWGIGFYTFVAIHTAFGMVVAVAATLMTRSTEGWLAGFSVSPDARELLVQLLPMAVALPMGLGFLLLFGSGVGAYNAPFGFALFVPSMALALVVVVLRAARRARGGELALRASRTALRESEQRLSSALAIAQLGTFEWRLATDEVSLDARSREIFGFADGEGTTAEQLFDRIHPDDLQRVLAEVRASRDRLSRLETEYRIVLNDGSVRSIVSLSNAEGRETAERIFGVFGDISDRKRLEEDLRQLNDTLEERVRERSTELERVHEQLRQSQKLEAMGQLTGGVAHDFNNLLSPIIGSLDLIQRRGVDGERSQRLVEGALASAERAKGLVQRLLAFARRQPLETRAVDVAHLLGEMSDLIAATAGPRIQLQIDVEPGLPSARADANQLEMAILNLAVNARDAMTDGGSLHIAAAAEEVAASVDAPLAPGSYIRISVADSGVGMDEATLARAIEPFFSTKGVGQGTGLGLSMVHGLAAQLGGELRLRSARGEGTTVELWLPVTKEGGDVPLDSARLGRSEGSGTALLVDDEEAVRASTAAMLSDLGYEVVEAASAEEALQRLGEEARLQLVVTDHLMPGMTGAELARAVKAGHPGLPILIISGYAEMDAIAPDLQRLAKPFRQSDLAAALTRLRG